MYYNNKRLALSVFWAVFGAVLIALSVAEVLDSTIYAGMGGGLMAVGILQVMRNLKYRRDDSYREQVDIEATDERSRFLRQKAWAWAGYAAVLIEAIISAGALVMGQEYLSRIMMSCVALLVFCFWGAYMLAARKY